MLPLPLLLPLPILLLPPPPAPPQAPTLCWRSWLPGATALCATPPRQPWQLQQEDNLAYVAFTRAQRELVFVEAPNAGRPRGER